MIDDEKIKNNFLEKIYSFFQIDLEKWMEIEFHLVYKGRLTISEIDNMEYYRVQYFLQNYQNYLEEENKRKQEQEGKQNKNMFDSPQKYMKESQGMMKGIGSGNSLSSKMSSMPNFNIPKL